MNEQKLSNKECRQFQEHIWSFYGKYGRLFPWRNVDDPYRVVISEVMLQQTQTYRVLPKYEQFITIFPSFNALAHVSLHEVLTVWQGLGYNRRGRYLHELAKQIMATFGGTVPRLPEQLITLPGIGPATASSIAAFAFNIPTVFIETNIRTVFITHFFPNQNKIHDQQLLPLVAQTVDQLNPREWYYALMDYGVMLKQQMVNPSRKSVHYTRQSKFEGSNRQVRGKILRLVTEKKEITLEDLVQYLPAESTRLDAIIDGLIKDGLLRKKSNRITI